MINVESENVLRKIIEIAPDGYKLFTHDDFNIEEAQKKIISFINDAKSGLSENQQALEKMSGTITILMDKAYDTISDAVAVIPGLGTAASAIMKGGALLGKGVNYGRKRKKCN